MRTFGRVVRTISERRLTSEGVFSGSDFSGSHIQRGVVGDGAEGFFAEESGEDELVVTALHGVDEEHGGGALARLRGLFGHGWYFAGGGILGNLAEASAA